MCYFTGHGRCPKSQKRVVKVGKLFGFICKTPSQVIAFHSKSKWLSHYNLLLPKIVPKGSPFQYPPPPTPPSHMEFAASLTRELYKNNMPWRQGGQGQEQDHSPEKLPPSMRGNKTKTTIFRERKPTYSMDDNDGRILGFVEQEDRNYPTPRGTRLGEAGNGLGGGKGKVM